MDPLATSMMHAQDQDKGKFTSTASHHTDFGTDVELLSLLQQQKSQYSENSAVYLSAHPEIQTLLRDYLKACMRRKPENVFEFTQQYFRVIAKP